MHSTILVYTKQYIKISLYIPSSTYKYTCLNQVIHSNVLDYTLSLDYI